MELDNFKVNIKNYLIEIKLKTLNFEVLETQIPLGNGTWRLASQSPKFENCFSENYTIDIVIKKNLNSNQSQNKESKKSFYNTFKETYIIQNEKLFTKNSNILEEEKDVYRLNLKKINEEYIFFLTNPYDIFIVNDNNNENILFKIQINKELVQKGNLEPKLLLLFERI